MVENNETPSSEPPKEKPQEETISSYCNPQTVQQLIEIGFSKTVAEKALFLNGQNFDKAMDYIDQHQNDPDFEEELKIVGRTEEE